LIIFPKRKRRKSKSALVAEQSEYGLRNVISSVKIVLCGKGRISNSMSPIRKILYKNIV